MPHGTCLETLDMGKQSAVAIVREYYPSGRGAN